MEDFPEDDDEFEGKKPRKISVPTPGDLKPFLGFLDKKEEPQKPSRLLSEPEKPTTDTKKERVDEKRGRKAGAKINKLPEKETVESMRRKIEAKIKLNDENWKKTLETVKANYEANKLIKPDADNEKDR